MHGLLQGVFLFGMSEGAVTLSTFNDEYFASMVRFVVRHTHCSSTQPWPMQAGCMVAARRYCGPA